MESGRYLLRLFRSHRTGSPTAMTTIKVGSATCVQKPFPQETSGAQSPSASTIIKKMPTGTPTRAAKAQPHFPPRVGPPTYPLSLTSGSIRLCLISTMSGKRTLADGGEQFSFEPRQAGGSRVKFGMSGSGGAADGFADARAAGPLSFSRLADIAFQMARRHRQVR